MTKNSQNSRFNTVGIVAAMQVEIDGIKSKIENAITETVSGIEYVSGRIGDKAVVAAKCGVGKVFAAMCTQTMILKYKPDCIINTGVAGGLADVLSLLDVVVADGVVQHDMDTSGLGDPVGMISGINKVVIPTDKTVTDALRRGVSATGAVCRTGIVASGDCFINDNEKKKQIKDTFGAAACEMEGAAVGQVCFANSVSFGVLRAISDGGDSDAALDFPVFAAKAAEISINAVVEFLRLI